MQIEISDTASQKIRELKERIVPHSRQEMVNEIANDVLLNAAQGNPVKTGRSRAGWKAAAQQVSGGSSTGNSNQEGVSGEGSATSSQDRTTSSVNASNNVPYVTYLEYGTSRMAPVAMLRQSLAGVLGRIGSFFRLSQ